MAVEHLDGTGSSKGGSEIDVLARANRAIAHDLRNVFSVINSCAVDLYEEMHGRRAGALVLEILNAAEQGLLATTDLLHAGPGGLADDRPIDLCRHTGELEPILRRLAGADVDLVIGCRSPGSFARIDRTSLMQILMNLVVNASDAMERRGRIEIGIGRAVRMVPGGDPEQFVTVTVTDGGPGIPVDVVGHIFDDGFSTKTGQHFGVGLAVVRRVVERCGGTIEVASTLGEGTTFRLELPLASGRFSNVALVAVADDTARALLTAELEARGFAVCAATDALEACDLVVGKGVADVAVLDSLAAADSGLWAIARLGDAPAVIAVGDGTPRRMPSTAAEAAAILDETGC